MFRYCIFACLVLALTSCFKKKKFASRPFIQFESFTILPDETAKLTLRFQDGEGDIGLEENQTASPYDSNSRYYYNLYLVYYEKKDGKGFQVGKDVNGDSIVFRNRLLPVYRGKDKSIEGVIEYSLEPFYYNFTSSDSDTLLYKVVLIDRALNESNWIETNVIVR